MNHFPKGIQFKYPWRTYQQRVLDELNTHLEDNHLHLIAPPGSGKTVLGLEVMLRLNKPTLILAPSLAIRNQWIVRFQELFLQSESVPEWISTDIRKPAFVTVSTYQGLDAASDSESDQTEILEKYRVINLGTIVVDEAHHLKNEWWKSLIRLKNELKPTIVGLTATPPYDVSYAEWTRYLELNGPVDTEISVPELVKEGDLCPHQDYVLISDPSLEEYGKLLDFHEKVEKLYKELSRDPVLIDFLMQLEIIKFPDTQLEWIYSNMEVYSAMLVYLHHNDAKLSKHHFELTGNRKNQLPKLTYDWLDILLDYYLFQYEAVSEETKAHQKQVIATLSKAGLIERNKVNFYNDDKIEKYLTSSMSKLEGIHEITLHEYSSLKNELRQVILCDFIRDEFLSPHLPITKMGVAPVFESLRRKLDDNIRVGVLTGSLVIIPAEAEELLLVEVKRLSISKVTLKPLSYDEQYLILTLDSEIRSVFVQLITSVFEKGGIQVLIGTKSLLGEGWDAPSINVLVLATFVGSFVLSNQMRGRAIRTVRGDEHKTGNIWHLVCRDPLNPEGGKDIDLLKRRFKAFVGISERENRTIENGIQRLLIPEKLDKENFQEFNQKMLQSASEREHLKQQWHDGVQNGTRLVEEIKVPFSGNRPYQKQKKLYVQKTIGYLLAELFIGLSAFSSEFLQLVFKTNLRRLFFDDEGQRTILGLFLFGLFVFFGRKLFKSIYLFFKYRDIGDDLHGIGQALLESLQKIGLLNPNTAYRVVTTKNEFGEVFAHLEGGTSFDKSLFVSSLQEIIAPVSSPRYLIIRKSRLWRIFNQKDFHSVPDLLGKKKEEAAVFENFWKKHVGRCELVYTKHLEGRKWLLKARFNSLASNFEEKPNLSNRWK